jgi:hypothetical protein
MIHCVELGIVQYNPVKEITFYLTTTKVNLL